MSSPGNAAKKAEDLFGADLLSDPAFKPCRDEGCRRKDLHAEHEIESRLGRKIHEGYSNCPQCQTPVIVTSTRRKQIGKKRISGRTAEARCPNCGWTHTKSSKKGPQDA